MDPKCFYSKKLTYSNSNNDIEISDESVFSDSVMIQIACQLDLRHFKMTLPIVNVLIMMIMIQILFSPQILVQEYQFGKIFNIKMVSMIKF